MESYLCDGAKRTNNRGRDRDSDRSKDRDRGGHRSYRRSSDSFGDRSGGISGIHGGSSNGSFIDVVVAEGRCCYWYWYGVTRFGVTCGCCCGCGCCRCCCGGSRYWLIQIFTIKSDRIGRDDMGSGGDGCCRRRRWGFLRRWYIAW